jgi:DNA-binding MarR family transcriptional regulator
VTEAADVAGLGLLLGRLERLNESLVVEVCSADGVSPAELRVLAMLRHGAPPDGVRPTDISRWVVQTSGGLTATLRRLEGAGRIERTEDPDDGRGRRVSLTAAGRAFYDRLFTELTDRYAYVLDGLDAEATTDAVKTVIDAFERAAGLTPTADWDLTRTLAADTDTPA